MKLLLIAFAVIAVVAAGSSHLPSSEYLPPAQESVSYEAPSSEYLPPTQSFQSQAPAPAPVQVVQSYSAPVEAAPAHELADDGYRYKARRRVVYRRHRRDASHLPSSEYLPPAQESVSYEAPSSEYLPPTQSFQSQAPAPAPVQVVQSYSAPVEAAPAHELADDGYRYKTHRRVVYRRHRRDASHLPSSEYLPPAQESVSYEAPSSEYLPPTQSFQSQAPAPAPVQVVQSYSAPVEAAPAHELADDGYRYKTHRRVVYRRHRRDASHLPSSEYLPPAQESVSYEAPSSEYLPPTQSFQSQAPAPAPVQVVQSYSAPVEAAPAHELADDGYRYKTHRRVVYRRHRRDASHLPSSEYLPPAQESVSYEAPSSEYLPPTQSFQSQAPAPAPVQVVQSYSAPVEAAPAHELADDGYRYKTHRRVVYRRHRRDASHLPSSEYLPPAQESVSYEAPSSEYLPPTQSFQSQAPAPAPVQVVQSYSAPVEAAPAHELADDGYRYKTHRRVVFRRRH